MSGLPIEAEAPSDEPRDTRERRLQMRSMRRGIKEMDLILQDFASRRVAAMSDAELGLYDRLLSENDHDLYAWVSGALPVPERYAALVAEIADGARGVTRPR
ncbi:succinate dehydrogenase assembly factor 2 [Limimaricola cinnabarinus]|uniref:FAD assembly factor SdhE n=1 Tax=Limimaricola cinnabarinus LL-001 TaxID=1337093 RepID=U3AGV4_9RHOB|nr:succinate dehydrogenase assembly factor 2 [Limimaricola cinnabarinus]GAD54028.1 ygfY protein [Limimaricola cinnabarinus LL-001]